MKRYATFEEIDKDLKYLRLKSRIDKEEFKLSLHKAKATIHDTFSPLNFVAGTVGSIVKTAAVFKIVKKVIKMVKN